MAYISYIMFDQTWNGNDNHEQEKQRGGGPHFFPTPGIVIAHHGIPLCSWNYL